MPFWAFVHHLLVPDAAIAIADVIARMNGE
jgi:hypothetical protein